MVFRHALRSFRHQSFLATVAGGSLAVGLGLAVTLASVSDAILFRPLPVPDADRLTRVFTASKLHPLGFVSYPDFEDLSKASSLAGVAAQCRITVALGLPKETPQVRLGLAVSPDYFAVLGVPAVRGRIFHSADDRQPVVILSHSFWHSQFGGRSDIVGTTIEAGGQPFTIVGIAPSGFGLDPFFHEDFYVLASAYAAGHLPGSGNPLLDRSRRYLSLYARLAPGSSREQAQAELGAISERLARQYPATNRDSRALVLKESEARKRSNAATNVLSEMLLAGALLALLAACANVSGLLLLRGESRLGEYALRAAFGEGRVRMLAERIAESLLLAAFSLPVAYVLALVSFLLVGSVTALPSDLPVSMDPRLDHRVTASSLAGAVLVALVCAVIPWMELRKAREANHLKEAFARSGAVSSRRKLLVALQVAIATTLLSTSGTLVKGWLTARRADLGYKPAGILTMAFDPAQVRTTEGTARRFYERILSVLGDAPGYFGLLRMPVLSGREFTGEDGENGPSVAIVNEAMAAYWPGGDAIGRGMHVNGRLVHVVGIVPTIEYFELGERPKPFVYLPFEQNYVSRMVLHARTRTEPAAFTSTVLAAIRNIDSRQPISEIRTLETYRDRSGFFEARIGFSLLPVAAASTILLALIGVGSIIARMIQSRSRELSIRRALGASTLTIVRGAVAPTFLYAGSGAVFGAATAFCVAPLLRPFALAGAHPEIQMADASCASMVAACLVVCCLPLYGLCRLEPAVALKKI